MPAGRPTEYSLEILESAKAYLDSCQDTEEQQVIGLSAKGTELYKQKLKVNLPSIEGLALYLHVHKDTLYEWEKIHPEFSDVLGDIRAKQADRLINNGLSGDYNPTIAKLLLTKHGYSDKTETDVTSGGKPLPILASMNVSTHNSDQQNSEAEQENTGNPGRDISQQDNLNTPLIDSLQSDGQNS
jgi:hypothetical protein